MAARMQGESVGTTRDKPGHQRGCLIIPYLGIHRLDDARMGQGFVQHRLPCGLSESPHRGHGGDLQDGIGAEREEDSSLAPASDQGSIPEAAVLRYDVRIVLHGDKGRQVMGAGL